jgi:hypothetical protein
LIGLRSDSLLWLFWPRARGAGGVLVELGLVEQRFRAVTEVLEGASVVEVARRYGVVRQTVHDWLRRYAADGGLANLADRSSRPQSCPHQMPPSVEARVLGLRREHPGWGRRGSGTSWAGSRWSRCRAARACIGRWSGTG